VARITSGLGFGFLLHEFARQTGEHFGGMMGSHNKVSVDNKSVKEILGRWGREFWKRLKRHAQFASIVGDHFGKWAALATFPYVEDGLNAGFKLLFNTEQLDKLNRWQTGGRIFLVNFVFFFWAESIIRFFAWIGRSGQRAIDGRGRG
jgi:hypothetical protein